MSASLRFPGDNAHTQPNSARTAPSRNRSRSPATYPYIASRIINRLRAAEGGIVSKDDLISYCYENSPVPDDPVNVLDVLVHRLRRKGYPIETVHGRGLRYAWTEWQVSLPGVRATTVPPRRSGLGHLPASSPDDAGLSIRSAA